MKRPARLLLPLLAIMALSGCHTDPFGLKPEVRGVEIPEKPASQAPGDTEEPASEAPDPE